MRSRNSRGLVAATLGCQPRLLKTLNLVIPRSPGDEESAVFLDFGELQIPRAARDDNSRRS